MKTRKRNTQKQIMKLKAIVRTYIEHIRPLAEDELNCFRDQPTLISAVENAALAINNEQKRYSHQRRLKKTTLEQAKMVLLKNIEMVEQAKTFDELFTLIELLLEPIHGIGELYVYDTTLRIGAKRGLLPAKVYLHRGTRIGAKNLKLGEIIKGGTKSIDISSLPPEFQLLEPHEIEDVLCIFKDDLRDFQGDIGSKEMIKRSRCN